MSTWLTNWTVLQEEENILQACVWSTVQCLTSQHCQLVGVLYRGRDSHGALQHINYVTSQLHMSHFNLHSSCSRDE
jgi:hypothetical protein